jgi:hypothetical protein
MTLFVTLPADRHSPEFAAVQVCQLEVPDIDSSSALNRKCISLVSIYATSRIPWDTHGFGVVSASTGSRACVMRVSASPKGSNRAA